MSTIILRKPKFMRSEYAFDMYMRCVEIFNEQSTRPDLTMDEKLDLMKKTDECIDKAAKAGGFFSTKDFLKWLNKKAYF